MSLVKMNHWDFEKGVQVDRKQINDWHAEVLKAFETDPELQEHIHRTGNGMVIGRRVKREEDIEGVEIFEIKNGYQFYKYEFQS